MTKILHRAAAAALALTLLLPTTAAADNNAKTWIGVGVLVTGGFLSFGSLEYGTSCPAGYTTHYFDDIPDQCSYLGRTYTDVTEASTEISMPYPKAFYSGLGLMGAGILILALPRKARKHAPDVAFSPKGVTVGKTLRW